MYDTRSMEGGAVFVVCIFELILRCLPNSVARASRPSPVLNTHRRPEPIIETYDKKEVQSNSVDITTSLDPRHANTSNARLMRNVLFETRIHLVREAGPQRKDRLGIAQPC
jgi:hypothetical protein